MKRILTVFASVVLHFSCNAQQKNDLVLDKITNGICKCYNNTSDKTEDSLDKILLRECIEETTKQEISEILIYYKVATFSELNLEKYLNNLQSKLIENCKLKQIFINETFKTISLK